MIHSLTGRLVSKKEYIAAIQVGDIVFKVFVSNATSAILPTVGRSITLFCHLYVREDALDLYGFLEERDLVLFEALISISGVGPKSALSIMSITKTDRLIAAVNEGKIELLSRASGIGKKTAQRIALELKGKFDVGTQAQTLSLLETDLDLEETLVGLGYTKAQAKVAISKLDPNVKDFNARLKAVLQRQKK